MNLAALETSARPASVALLVDGRASERVLTADRSHARDLLPALRELLLLEGREPRAIGGLLVGVGPGSYTGLRVGIATALGLARGLETVLRGLCSFEVLAFGELEPGEECTVLLDARQGALYHARYRREEADVLELDPPRALEPTEAARRTPSEGVLFAEPAALQQARLEAHPGVRPVHAPRASALLALGSRRLETLGPQDPRTVQPLYLRAFAAHARRR